MALALSPLQGRERLRWATALIRAPHASSPTARARQDPAPCPRLHLNPHSERPAAANLQEPVTSFAHRTRAPVLSGRELNDTLTFAWHNWKYIFLHVYTLMNLAVHAQTVYRAGSSRQPRLRHGVQLPRSRPRGNFQTLQLLWLGLCSGLLCTFVCTQILPTYSRKTACPRSRQSRRQTPCHEWSAAHAAVAPARL